MRKFFLAVGVVIAVFVLAALALFVITPRHKELPMPNPNGYDDLVKAGRRVVPVDSDFSEAHLRSLVASNAPALRLARAGLRKECRVVQYYSANSSAKLDQAAALKALSQAFLAESRLAELEKRPNDAVQSCLDMLQMARACTRGGIMLDSFVALAIENLALGCLDNLVPLLDSQCLRTTILALEKLETERESVEALKRNEETWAQKTYGWKGAIIKLIVSGTLRSHEKRWITQVQNQKEHVASLLLALATRTYELENGAAPGRVEDLVPKYLKSLPAKARTLNPPHTNPSLDSISK